MILLELNIPSGANIKAKRQQSSPFFTPHLFLSPLRVDIPATPNHPLQASSTTTFSPLSLSKLPFLSLNPPPYSLIPTTISNPSSLSLQFLTQEQPWPSSSPIWGSLSLSENSPPITKSKTVVSFPSVLKVSQRVLGVGLKKKSIIWLKNIDVYAFVNHNFF